MRKEISIEGIEVLNNGSKSSYPWEVQSCENEQVQRLIHAGFWINNIVEAGSDYLVFTSVYGMTETMLGGEYPQLVEVRHSAYETRLTFCIEK